MAISYKKLWKLLIDKDMKKKDLQKAAGISAASITRREPSASGRGAVRWKALLPVAAPFNQANDAQDGACASPCRASPCCSSRMAAAPSLKMVPERFASKGRMVSSVMVFRLLRPHQL